MDPLHDIQALSDVDIHVYEAVAGESGEDGWAGFGALVRATGLTEEEVRQSLQTLIGQGYVVPADQGYGLGPHTFGVER
jgi:DNA-binding IclR family transcriptional regulator